MKLTFSPDGSWVVHALHLDKDEVPHWHIAARSDGFRHPHWARVLGLIFPGWRPKTFKIYRAGIVKLFAWQFRKRDGWQWRHCATKTANWWARAT